MTISLEYHLVVRQSIRYLAVLATFALFVPTGLAQINGAPASVTSPGFGGRQINGTSPSVTSVGPGGYTLGPRAPLSAAPHSGHANDVHRHHRNQGEYLGPYMYAVPVPYAVDSGAQDYSDDSENDPNYQGGPTVFDRRGTGASSYVPPMQDGSAARTEETAKADEDADPVPTVPTLLVFKDGRELEVGNYAIVGTTLFDLTPGHSRRIALAELNLPATRQQNDDRGVVFQLPASTQEN